MDINLYLPHENNLKIEYLSHVFDRSRISTCYKYFWFLAILKNTSESKTEFTYDELVTEMVADSWYMVIDCKLRLGPSETTDNLEEAVKYLYKLYDGKVSASEKREVIIEKIKDEDDKRYLDYKKKIIENVPYCLQSPFYTPSIKNPQKNTIDEINSRKHLIYYFCEYNKLQTRIRLEKEWVAYIIKNRSILIDWTKYHLVNYLQARNPFATKIVNNLEPPLKRDLSRVKKYWSVIIELNPGMKEIYGKNDLKDISLSIDHFVPWQYVAHDELWNLTPTTKSINSKKSNNIACFEKYFCELAEQEYKTYQMRKEYSAVQKAFEHCVKYHVNNQDIYNALYKDELSFPQFKERLSNVIQPVYQNALNCGFKEWVYKEEACW